MPVPRDILDLIIVPDDPLREVDDDAVTALFDRWQEGGMLAPGTGPLRRTAGPRAWALVPGGFELAWLDRPSGVALYANQLGGFKVMCPACQAPAALAFGRAVQAWRAGGDPTLVCGHCGDTRPVADVPLHPPGAFGRGAVIFADAQALEPGARALNALREALGPVKVVLRRRG